MKGASETFVTLRPNTILGDYIIMNAANQNLEDNQLSDDDLDNVTGGLVILIAIIAKPKPRYSFEDTGTIHKPKSKYSFEDSR